MSLYYDQVKRDLKEIEATLDSQTILRGGQGYLAVIGPVQKGVTIDPKTGNEVQFSQTVLVRKELMETAPAVGEIISVPEPREDDPVRRKINLVTGEGVYWVLRLIDLGA